MSSPAQVGDLHPLKSPLKYLRVSKRFVFVNESRPGPERTTAALLSHGGHSPNGMCYTWHVPCLRHLQGNKE